MRSPTLRAAVLCAAVIGSDQATKALVRASIARGDREAVFPGVNLVNVRNRGVAFGFLSDGGTILTIVVAAALLALLVFFFTHRSRPLAWLPTGMLLGGALGNLIDRVRDKAVTDFIDLPLWPAFNFADIAITAGVLALLYVLEGPPRNADPG